MSNKTHPVRVLHILQRMEAGGTQALLMNSYRRMDRTKLQFDFLVEYPDRQFYDDEIESLGGCVYRTNVRKNANIPAFIRKLRQLIKENDYRVVHVHTYSIGYFCLREARRCGVPVRIAHSHNNQMTKGPLYVPKLIMQKLYCIHANRFMACSDDAGRYLFGKRDFIVVKNAIDVDSFCFNETVRMNVRKELGAGGSLVVGSVGRLHQQKNQMFLLEVFCELKKLSPNSKLLLIGDGPDKAKLENRATELGIADDFILLSNRRDLARLYQAMDVFVLPSLFEGLGIVAIEAQSSGLPTVCSDGVSEDANVSPLFRRCSLSASPKTWARTIVAVAGSRNSEIGAVGAKAHGFDVNENATILQQWYLKEIADV